MLTTLELAAILSATPAAPPEAMTAVAKAEDDVATAAELERSCWTPRECVLAHALAVAASDSLSWARTVAGLVVGAGKDNPFADEDPFDDDWPPFAGTPFPGAEDVATMIAEGVALAGTVTP